MFVFVQWCLIVINLVLGSSNTCSWMQLVCSVPHGHEIIMRNIEILLECGLNLDLDGDGILDPMLGFSNVVSCGLKRFYFRVS